MRTTITLTVVALAAVAAIASAQPRPRPVQTMALTSSAWTDGGAMPAPHTQRGRDVSPPLAWSGVPEGTHSFVLVVHDLDEIAPQTGDDRLHWRFPAALGDRHPLAAIDPAHAPKRAYTPRVKLQRKGKKSGGCG